MTTEEYLARMREVVVQVRWTAPPAPTPPDGRNLTSINLTANQRMQIFHYQLDEERWKEVDTFVNLIFDNIREAMSDAEDVPPSPIHAVHSSDSGGEDDS